ncbi:MAG: hypothetical protein IPO08_23505 [Xanthomonadales bacterium]|nr:hypothetical protein [Xanthomonadales bacterium]
MATKILKKLTIRDVVGGKAEILKAAQSGRSVSKDENGKDVYSATGVAVPLMSVIGRVHDFTPGQSDHGAFLKLKGDFEATNLVTGEVFSDVGTCILPNFISDLVANALKGGAQGVDFAVRVDTRYDEAAATMYVFDAVSLMPARESDSISAIKNALQAAGVALPAPAGLKALEAPKPEPVPEPAQAPAKQAPKKK